MPLYEYRCIECKRIDGNFSCIDDRDQVFKCTCGGAMHRILNHQYGISMGVGSYGYFDETLNTYVHTNAHKRRVMQEQGVSEKYGKGWK
jgi:putative FmdB family regulatory protein